jgi:hypothetical protein
MQPFVDALVALFALIAAHKIAVVVALFLLLLYFVFNAYVSSLPEPDDPKSKYAFKYRFLNRLSGNFDKVAKALHVPGSEDTPKP